MGDPPLTLGEHQLAAVPWQSADLASQDLVLILTNHPEFDMRRVAGEAPLVVGLVALCRACQSLPVQLARDV